MRCKLRPQLAPAEAQQTARSEISVGSSQVKSGQYTLIIPHKVIQLTAVSFWIPETRLRLPQVNKEGNSLRSWWSIDTKASSVCVFLSASSPRELCSQPVRGSVRRTGRMFPEHVERRFLDPEYSFVAVRRIHPTRFAKQKLAQSRTN